MKKATPQKFSKRLVKYSALSVALAGLTDVAGQINYTDVDPDMGPLIFQLDLDGGGIVDYNIIESGGNVQIIPGAGNGVIASYVHLGGPPSNRYIYPFALSFNDPINSTNSNWSSAYVQFMRLYNGSCSGNSNWCGVNDKYLGLKFNIGTDTHYGWARLRVDSSTSYVIKDYAYNATQTIPGQGDPINAGQTTLGLQDNELSKIKIVALNKSITLFNLPQQTNYRLFSLTGQSVLDGKITNNTYVIEANTLATGVYIIELEDADSNAVIRKKIVL